MDQMITSTYSDSQSTDKHITIFTNLTNSYNSTTMYLDENELYNNASNFTIHAHDWRATYKPVLDFLVMITLIIMLLAMGCEIDMRTLLNHVRRPIGLCIGLFSQFVILPLSAFCILLISGIQGLQATGVLIISCSPGGGLSNTFTYFSDGDVALSVAMTAASTVVAMGMMPLNVWMYGRHFESNDLIMPYKKMAMSLITLTSPVIIGMLMRWKLPRIAAVTTKIGSSLSITLLFICVGIQIAMFPNMITEISLKLYIVIFALPVIGLSLGYALATLMRQSKPVRKTISIECGIQNVPIALTVIALSFTLEMQKQIILLPLLYSFTAIMGCSTFCLGNYIWKRCFQKAEEDPQVDIAAKQNLLTGSRENVDPCCSVIIKCNLGKHEKEAHVNDSYV